MSETKVAPEASVTTTEDGGLLEQVVAATKQTEPDRAQELVKTLIEQALTGTDGAIMDHHTCGEGPA